jgi:phosphoesterase RecJ-like protein
VFSSPFFVLLPFKLFLTFTEDSVGAMLSYKRFAELLLNHNSIVISSHINPDGDAIGSELGMYYALKKIGKQVRIINYSAVPRELKFLDNENVVEQYSPRKHNKIISDSDMFLFLDINQIDRVASMEKIFRKNSDKLKIYIDHHQGPDDFADDMILKPEVGSVGEIVFDILDKTKLAEIDVRMATALYTAIITDTGSFRYERTTPKTHMIAAKLLRYGVNPKTTYELLYEQDKINRLKLLGKALISTRVDGNGKVCSMVIRNKDIEEVGGTESDIEGFVGYTLTLEGVRIGLFFLEFEDGFKVSYRSRGTIPMNKLAGEFGGGGHINAAGSRLDGKNLDEFMPKVISKAVEYLRFDS